MKIKREVLDDENDTKPGQMYSSWNAPGTVQAEPRENHIDIRPTVSGPIESGRSLKATQGTSERRSFLDVFSQYIAASQETVMGEDNIYSEERDIHLNNIKKEPDDVHSAVQVDDADQFSSVEGEQLECFQGHNRNQDQEKRQENQFNLKTQETTKVCEEEKVRPCEIRIVDVRQSSAGKEFEVQEKRRGRWATERTDSGNKCLSEERNNHDSMRPGSVQGEIEGSPMNYKTVGQTSSNSGVGDTLINSGTIPTNLNKENNGSQNCSGKDVQNDNTCNVLTECLSSNVMIQSKNRFVPLACDKEENLFHSSECKEMFPRITLSIKRNKTAVKSLSCTFCDLRFSHDSDLEKHMTIHTREEPLENAQCGRGFALEESNFTVETLSGGNPYQCTVCNKRFAKCIGLSTHMKSHNVEKPHRCPQCGKHFAVKNTLTVHLRTHSGEKPYQCPVCNKTFSQCSGLKTHMHMHSGTKPHQCPQCGKRFSLKNTLNVHLRTHSGEKPYECCVCNKRFAQSSSVSVHMRTHTKEKPYQCPLCYKSFGYKNTLNTHFINGHTLDNT